MRAVVFLALLAVAFAATKPAYICEVPVDLDDSFSAPTLLGQPFHQYNAIIFGDFKATTSDVEGAVAVQGNFNVGQGYSVGDKRHTTGVSAVDVPITYSLVVGGSATWKDGRLYPEGTNAPFPASKENAYVIGSFTTSNANSFAGRVVKGTTGAVDADFTNALAYYKAVSAAMAAMPATGSITVQYSTIYFACPSSSLSQVVFNVDAAAFRQVTDLAIDPVKPCHNDSQFIINVVGTADLTFPGGELEHNERRVVYNVIGNRKVNVPTRVLGSILAPTSTYSQTGGVVLGYVIVASAPKNTWQINWNHCAIPKIPDAPNTCVGFETDCAGLKFTAATNALNFREFNAIVFGDFNADTGDIEKRLAVKGNAVFGNGYSVGAILSTLGNTPDLAQAYSLVVGGALTWGSGSLHPDTERAFVGAASSAPAYIDRIDANLGSLDAVFDAAQKCYKSYSAAFSAKADNVKVTVEYMGLFITCADNRASEYVMTLTATQLSQVTYASTSGCNFQGRWVINVPGTDDVTITGDSFPAIAGGVVYNIPGARKINLHDTVLTGHLLAPEAELSQQYGTIIGKVVVGSVKISNQINSMDTCPNVVPVVLTIIATESASKGSNTVKVANAADLRVKDVTTFGTIKAINGDTITVDKALTNNVSAGASVGTVTLRSSEGRAVYDNEVSTSSASMVGVAAAAIVVAALMI